MIDSEQRATIKIDAPKASDVKAMVAGKTYPMTRDSNGSWSVTTDPLVVGFHYYFLDIDSVRVTDPGTETFSVIAGLPADWKCRKERRATIIVHIAT